MRTVIRVLILCLNILSLGMMSQDSFGSMLSVARGFQQGKCYQHTSVRHCDFEKEGFECYLELFPDSNGALHLKLNSQVDFLIRDRKTVDYGVFVFKILSEDQHPVVIAGIQSKRSISLKELVEMDIGSLMAHEVPCL